MYEVGDKVTRREGDMRGVILKVGPNPKRRHTIANITVRWANGHVGKVSPGQIRAVIPARLERFRDVFEG